VAEEITMWTILSCAASLLQDGVAVGFPEQLSEEEATGLRDSVVDDLYLDTDFLFLFDGAADGIGAHPDEPVGAAMRMVNMAYADWFRPFGGHPGHPYFDEEEREAGGEECPWF
jgi:hypothetical protein